MAPNGAVSMCVRRTLTIYSPDDVILFKTVLSAPYVCLGFCDIDENGCVYRCCMENQLDTILCVFFIALASKVARPGVGMYLLLRVLN